jgi:hypothetical protein
MGGKSCGTATRRLVREAHSSIKVALSIHQCEGAGGADEDGAPLKYGLVAQTPPRKAEERLQLRRKGYRIVCVRRRGCVVER